MTTSTLQLLAEEPYVDHYTLALSDGPGYQYQLNVIPHKKFGFGHVLNTAKTGTRPCNCEIQIFLTKEGFATLLRTTRKVAADEELQWDYAGQLGEYETTGFLKK